MHVVAGRYHLVAPLGAGGAGTVWRAQDAVLRREVAVKQVRLPSDPARRDKALEDTLREARAAAALNHPAIITVHDVIAEQGQPWIVMDLLAGRSLADLIKESGRLPSGQVATIGLRVLDALDAAHRRGILHRDVKPGNVIITDAGEAILTDFGIAAQIDPRNGGGPGAASALAAAEQSGTPGYVAPERLRGEPTGPASDHWSLAATLYTAVEGQSPFRRDTPMAMVAAVLTQPPLPAVHAGPIGGLLMALLDKNPAARPPLSVIRDVLGPIAAPLPARRPVTGPATPARHPADPSTGSPTGSSTGPSSGIATMPMPQGKSRLPLVLAGLTAATALTVSAVLLVNASTGTTPPPDTRTIAQPSNGPSGEPSGEPSARSTTTASPTAGTTGSPRPPGAGKFATAPAACGLVTEDQAAKIIPGLRQRQTGMNPAECGWTGGEDTITLKVTHSATVAAARKVFDGRKDAQASKAGSSGGSTYEAVRDLPGVGDGAFGQNWWATTFTQTHSIVWLRVSNVVVQIDAATFDEAKPQAKHQNWARKLAGAAADTLRNTSPQDTG
ncbi:hypothetical protein GCM10009733_043400 [Nonomuraea maheshkhaliensis]|uniref:non-specific serine/threonine protein kinase n=1 Tax=Nonomuraea maheshkhaliensis TaxID=419590 RepID=A0ABN2FEX9_9ACTN